MNPYRRDRVDYEGEGLSEERAPQAPLEIVEDWLRAAVERQAERGDVPEPMAMSVATVDADGVPDVRTVLLRGLDRRGPAFYTSNRSAKGRQLAASPGVAASLTWPAMFRAVRFRGYAELLPAEEVLDYFRTRPWGARISAHASAQSEPVRDRATLEAAYEDAARRFPDTGSPDDVPVPEGWGGYRLVADRVELWEGRRSRLHDRLVWERVAPGGLDEPTAWSRVRLAP
ncbi:pyridoxamine 5'-phosphate oxidase [Ornithinimicrobium pekingense]|uniref:Pyridoxamine 5'-phosphate oxidase n=1 Tax=Ornithinimicrobium pekingense TaxID=384677 RepID=A0ABQ2F6W1_9MICO|nr:pyridoxamine 5'-phosphate oxidase [Ornithinimicrobium pekingense]GGK58721.1 pyridoxine/pyridoxamine 5'-phosphate oxidase [Ornithinimicrobium pekingense]